jgi:C-methyltransferase
MTPDQLMQMFQGIQATGLLRAAVELDLFSAIDKRGKATSALIAQDVGAPSRTTRIIVEGLAALGIVAIDDDQVSLSEIAANHLVPGKPAYMGDLTRVFGNDMVFDAYRSLSKAAKQGGSVLPEHAEVPRHPFWEDFAKYTAGMAAPGGAALAELLSDWATDRDQLRVLDVACGTGLYGYQLAKRYPKAHVTSQDWPNVLDVTRGYADAWQVADRVSELAGDMFALDWQGPYDLIVLSHVFHHFADDRAAELLDKARAALSDDGRIVIHDFVRGIAPPQEDPAPYMFSTMMLGWTQRGEAYDLARFNRLLAEAQFSGAEVHSAAPMPTRFLVASGLVATGE